MTVKRCCANCCFCASGDHSTLICRKYAPAVGGWPTVNSFDWCGEIEYSPEAIRIEATAQEIARAELREADLGVRVTLINGEPVELDQRHSADNDEIPF